MASYELLFWPPHPPEVVVFYSVRAWHMYYGSWQECWLSYTDLVTAGILKFFCSNLIHLYSSIVDPSLWHTLHRRVPRNLWLSSLWRRQELLSSALARDRVQNALRHCTQTEPDSMLLRSWLVKSSLEEENLANATAAANKNKTT